MNRGGFAVAVRRRHYASYDEHPSVQTLTAASVDVLPVAGATLNLIDTIRMPLGASDSYAASVERLEMTLGEGPALTAAKHAGATSADEATIKIRWPVFHHELVASTPYRSVMTVPLALGGFVGSLDLYLTTPDIVELPSTAEVWRDVGQPMVELPLAMPASIDNTGATVPQWLNGRCVTARRAVSVALGILMDAAALPATNGLSALRGYSFGHALDLDQTAQLVMAGTVTIDEIIGCVS